MNKAVFEKFDLITFLSSGSIKIEKSDGTVYKKNIATTPIKLTVVSQGEPWKVKVEENPEPPLYQSIHPFGVNDFGDIVFGEVTNKVPLHLRKRKGVAESAIELAKSTPGFYVALKDTIGTDDMRNGKVNVNIFSIEDKPIFLKIGAVGNPTQTGATYDLKIGYYEADVEDMEDD